MATILDDGFTNGDWETNWEIDSHAGNLTPTAYSESGDSNLILFIVPSGATKGKNGTCKIMTKGGDVLSYGVYETRFKVLNTSCRGSNAGVYVGMGLWNFTDSTQHEVMMGFYNESPTNDDFQILTTKDRPRDMASDPDNIYHSKIVDESVTFSSFSSWHTIRFDYQAAYVKGYLDGVLVLTKTNLIPSKPMTLVIGCRVTGNGSLSAALNVVWDYVTITDNTPEPAPDPVPVPAPDPIPPVDPNPPEPPEPPTPGVYNINVSKVVIPGQQMTDEILNKTFDAVLFENLTDPTTTGAGVLIVDRKQVKTSFDGSSWGYQLQLRSQTSSYYWHAYFGDMATKHGTWIVTSDVSQNDYDGALILDGAGYLYNSSNGKDDEISFGKWVFHPGTYKIKLTSILGSDMGKINIYLDDAVFTTNKYNASTTYNNTKTWSWVNATRRDGEVRIKCIGKDASSSGYKVCLSRFEIFRVA